MWSFRLQPAGFSCLGLPYFCFAICVHDFHGPRPGRVIPAGKMCVHLILCSRRQRVFDDSHLIIFKQDLVMVGSNLERILRQAEHAQCKERCKEKEPGECASHFGFLLEGEMINGLVKPPRSKMQRASTKAGGLVHQPAYLPASTRCQKPS